MIPNRRPTRSERSLISKTLSENPGNDTLRIIAPILNRNAAQALSFARVHGWDGEGDPLAWLLREAAERPWIKIGDQSEQVA